MGRLFGTDGVRGVANTELTCELAMQIGRAVAVVLTRHTDQKPKILIGRDTRISSKMLEAALVAGICSVGADSETIGVIPTPAVAYLIGKYEADAGIMISASHNPVEFNGIKVFNKDGFKLSDELEDEIEQLILDEPGQFPLKEGTEIGRLYSRRSAPYDYVEHIAKAVKGNLLGIRVAIDCANGSASTTAEMLFRGLGATPLVINAEPTGGNINKNCGSTHIDRLSEFVKANNCQVGVAFDGDADRCLAVDENGNLVDGDKMLAIFADDMKNTGGLKKNTLVVTVMSNLGLFHFAKNRGIDTVSTKVGDRYVLEEMVANGYAIGGEQSGHIIFIEYANTGDGQLSAVKLLEIIKKSGKKLSEIASVVERFPQVMINVEANADQKNKYEADKTIHNTVKELDEKLGDNGRILVRASGTEPIIRVMVEGKSFDEINEIAMKISDVIKERLS